MSGAKNIFMFLSFRKVSILHMFLFSNLPIMYYIHNTERKREREIFAKMPNLKQMGGKNDVISSEY